jgi:hypothetical protein
MTDGLARYMRRIDENRKRLELLELLEEGSAAVHYMVNLPAMVFEDSVGGSSKDANGEIAPVWVMGGVEFPSITSGFRYPDHLPGGSSIKVEVTWYPKTAGSSETAVLTYRLAVRAVGESFGGGGGYDASSDITVNVPDAANEIAVATQTIALSYEPGDFIALQLELATDDVNHTLSRNFHFAGCLIQML